MKKLLSLFLVLVLCLSLMAPALAEAPVRGGSLTIAKTNKLTSFNPATTSSRNEDGYIYYMVFDTLISFDEAGNLAPKLATSWETSEDGLIFTLKLRDDVTFHDGTPFNAEAVKANLDWAIAEDTGHVYKTSELGNIVSIDVGATYKGYVGDCAGTFPVGEASPEALELIRITRQSFFEGIKFARAGNRLNDISAAVQQYAESHGCGVVRDYVGHGIGTKMHEDPEVPNYVPDRRERRPNPRLLPGMTLAVEPMINAGGPAVRVLSNKWTVVTVDGSLSAHYENTILITDGEPEILTLADDI